MKLFKKTNTSNLFYDEKLNLSQIANKFETDKGTEESLNLSWGKDYPQHRCMHYTVTYEKYMQLNKQDKLS